MSENMNYQSWESRSERIKELYSSMTKGEKSKFLNDLNRNYELIPNTMISKLSGHIKIKPIEVFAMEVEFGKRGINISIN